MDTPQQVPTPPQTKVKIIFVFACCAVIFIIANLAQDRKHFAGPKAQNRGTQNPSPISEVNIQPAAERQAIIVAPEYKIIKVRDFSVGPATRTELVLEVSEKITKAGAEACVRHIISDFMDEHDIISISLTSRKIAARDCRNPKARGLFAGTFRTLAHAVYCRPGLEYYNPWADDRNPDKDDFESYGIFKLAFPSSHVVSCDGIAL